MNWYPQNHQATPPKINPFVEKPPPLHPLPSTIANHCKRLQTTANFRPPFFHLFPLFRPSQFRTPAKPLPTPALRLFCSLFAPPLRPPPSGTPDKPLQTTANHRQPPQTSAKNPACLTTNGVLKTHFSRLAAYLISCAQKMCQSSRLFRSTAPGFTLPSSGMPSASRIVLRTSSPWM